jgi:hypothetical protein
VCVFAVLAVTKCFFGGGKKFFGRFRAILGGFFLHFLQKILENPDFSTPWPGILPGGQIAPGGGAPHLTPPLPLKNMYAYH